MSKNFYLTPEVNVTVMDTCDGLMLEISGEKASSSIEAEGRKFFNVSESDDTNFWNN